MTFSTTNPIQVLLVQLIFAEYRRSVYRKLSSHDKIKLTLLHNTRPCIASGEVGLENVSNEDRFKVVAEEFPMHIIGNKSLVWCTPVNKLLCKEKYDIIIHDFRTRYLSLFQTMRLQKRNGGKFILWGIGFSQKKTPILNLIRLFLLKYTDAVILYNKRDRDRYIKMGVNPNKIFVALNTIPFEDVEAAILYWDNERLNFFKKMNNIVDGPVLLHVGRMAEQKKLDILIHSTKYLVQKYPKLKVVLIGDGPHDQTYKNNVDKLSLSNNFIFPGQLNNENDLAPWFLISDIVVAPAQIGLLAIHAQSYGKPLIMCDNPIFHGPETDVFIPGKTGLVYEYGNIRSCCKQIESLLVNIDLRNYLSNFCYENIRRQCGVGNMVNGVLEAISYVTNTKLELFPPYP